MTNHAAVVAIELDIAKIKESFISCRAHEMAQKYGMDMREAATEAEDEWPAHLLSLAPKSCWNDCQFIGPLQADPCGTGDSPDARECSIHACPWGRK